MKKIFCLVLVLLVVSSGIQSQDLKLEEILAKYYRASGFDKLQNMKTIVMTGTLVQQDAMPVKITKMRPDKYKMDFEVQDIPAVQAYDGQKAWMIAPWTGNSAPQVMPEARAKDMKNRADFDGALFNYQTKGHKAELIGQETTDSIPVYKIKFTKNDGGIEYYLINAKDFLMHKRISFRVANGQEIEMETFYKDNKVVGGVIFPFVSETRIGGNLINRIEFDNIEFNIQVDEKTFEMPSK